MIFGAFMSEINSAKCKVNIFNPKELSEALDGLAHPNSLVDRLRDNFTVLKHLGIGEAREIGTIWRSVVKEEDLELRLIKLELLDTLVNNKLVNISDTLQYDSPDDISLQKSLRAVGTLLDVVSNRRATSLEQLSAGGGDSNQFQKLLKSLFEAEEIAAELSDQALVDTNFEKVGEIVSREQNASVKSILKKFYDV